MIRYVYHFIRNLSLSKVFSIFLLLSILMIVAGGFFGDGRILNHPLSYPQFIKFDNTLEFINSSFDIIKTECILWKLRLFFLVDMFWAPFLILLFYKILQHFKRFTKVKFYNPLFITISVLTLTIDYIENFCYSFYYSINPGYDFFRYIIGTKEFLYALLFILFLYLLLNPIFKRLIHFIKYSRISLLFIAIIIILITKIEMGGDIVIHLFYNPLSYFITLILIVTIAIPTAHYPEYFKIKSDKNNDKMNPPYLFSVNKEYVFKNSFWSKLFNKIIKNSPFRIIYYKSNPNYKITDEQTKIASQFSIFRKSIGLLLFVAFIYILLDNYQTYLNPKVSASKIVFFIFLFLVLFLSYISSLKNKASILVSKTILNTSEKKTINKFRNVVISFYWLLIVSVIAITTSSFIIAKYNWRASTIILTLAILLIMAITFIVFCVSRSWFKYVFSPISKKVTSEDQSPNYIDPTYKTNIKPAHKNLLYFNKLYWFSDNITYLRGILILGSISVTCFILLNINWLCNSHTNFITVLLIIYMTYYGLIVIYIKHQSYVKQNGSNLKFASFWKVFMPLFFTIAIIIGLFTVSTGNDLHYIQNNISRSKKEITLKSFDSIIKINNKHIFVSSYGGGLKSNVWTLLVLDELDNNDSTFLNSVRCLSGASGGSLGIANYTLMDKDPELRSKQIKDIANFNFITLDLTYLAGWDLIREYIPNIKNFTEFKGKDRAYYGMKQHLKALTNKTESLDTVNFFEEYYNVFERRKYFPPLIINTVATTGVQGIAFSIPINNNKEFDLIFPGAKNILNADTTKTLSYLGAVSPTNRFPLLSPSASIEGKGHFIDGGGFDNSAMLSTENLVNYYRKKDTVFAKKDAIRFLNINVSKNAYIQKFIDKHNIVTQKISASGELPAIIATAAATQGVPAYITNKLSNNNELTQIILPHTFTYIDLVNVLGGKPYFKDLKTKLEILDYIEDNNNTITRLIREHTVEEDSKSPIKNQVVQPATGRLMSKPSINFQKVMLKHSSVQEQFKVIKDFLDKN